MSESLGSFWVLYCDEHFLDRRAVKEDEAHAKLAAADAKCKHSIETMEQMQIVPDKSKEEENSKEETQANTR